MHPEQYATFYERHHAVLSKNQELSLENVNLKTQLASLQQRLYAFEQKLDSMGCPASYDTDTVSDCYRPQ